MKIYVIRHGQTESNKKKIVNGQGIDEMLAAEGIAQAQVMASQLPTSITHIYSSTLRRARHTTELINHQVQHTFSFHDELKEVSLGSLEGKTWEEIDSSLKTKKAYRSMHFDFRLHGGEALADVKKRILDFLEQIRGKHADHEALVVTHGGIIRLLHYLEHGNIPNEVDNLSLHEFDVPKILKRNRKTND